MQVNDIVKWQSTDQHGKFEYIGQVLALNVEKLGLTKMYVPSVGQIFFHPEDGKAKVIPKPAEFELIDQTRPVYNEMAAKARGGKKAVQSDVKPLQGASKATTLHNELEEFSTKKDDNKTRAIERYNLLKSDFNNTHPPRDVVMADFQQYLGFTKNTASTYQYNCKSDWCK